MKPRPRRRRSSPPGPPTPSWSKADIEHIVNLALGKLRGLGADRAEQERQIRAHLTDEEG